MRVEVSLFATLATYLPTPNSGDSVVLEVPEGTTVGDVVASLAIPSDLECLRVVNGRDAESAQRLEEGDVLAIFPPLAGGR